VAARGERSDRPVAGATDAPVGRRAGPFPDRQMAALEQQAEQERQYRLQLAEQAREQALRVFDEISRLMDKRRYRLRR
jgi:hypothetical protein